MRLRLLKNKRWVSWLLTVAFALMATVSRASWQCPDGHPCPPGCTMQHAGASPVGRARSLHACCLAPLPAAKPGGPHCPLCAVARPSHAHLTEQCTSPLCELHVKAKPFASVPSHADYVFDIEVPGILLSHASPVPAPEVTVIAAFGAPRAPPNRSVVRPPAPRAPPRLAFA